jgi:hypothetical protein
MRLSDCTLIPAEITVHEIAVLGSVAQGEAL